MSLLAFITILISAFMHATWNYLAKQSEGGFIFVWLYMAVSTIVYLPFVIGFFFISEVHFGWMEFVFIFGSAIVHMAYALTLQKGYRVGDLSIVYPLARGSAPMLIAVAAFFLFEERLSIIGMIGISFIVLSIFILTGDLRRFKQNNSGKAVFYGLLTGLLISFYTLLDKGAVSFILISPLLLNYGSILGQFLLMTPLALKEKEKVKKEWDMNKKKAIGVGILSPLAYILVLITMQFTPVSHVAPVREISILIGTVLGTKVLTEGMGVRRPAAAVIMVIGIISVALSN
ncbi:DMT transporter permease [Siminovitchia terrae]|uniref:EamA family transporter n=1 Tax=Siminovitchia terrae TaxID=1914933 RepID=A0A429X2J0_SIMTE|nr:EamA family transporter [Siminovitchia terrae]RST57428.1 EamA family transporter [Siminovitchia terrae]GIN89431.1 DMT transporter permease [Siminovitchia terrae]